MIRRTSRNRRLRQCAALVVGVNLLVTGCVGGRTETVERHRIDPTTARQFVLDRLRGGSAAVSRTTLGYRTLEEMLPNVDYHQENGQIDHASDLVVVGRVAKVEEGRAYLVHGDDAPAGERTSFDDPSPDVRWWTIVVVMDVDHAIGAPDPPEQVRFNMTLGRREDFDMMGSGLKALGRIVVFLHAQGLNQHDPSVWRVVEDGGFIATVAEDGTLALPAFEDSGRSATLLAATPRLEDLERAGNGPGRVIQLKGSPGAPTRVDAPAPDA